MHQPPLYKSFPKYDARRHFVIIDAIYRLKEKASLHYIALDIGATRAEVNRAINVIPEQYGVEIVKNGAIYTLISWGIINKKEMNNLLKIVR
ncbi:hypothetical protein R6242_16360 [Iodobacter sp. CM08]|uniref:hypothetical protein n=1 Tax=Iodobacter sp. CM08 TaxID=3085902 RepID=UPI0029812BDA|nr:hypothetical protein [Iodobacter sp. CM08]MDW5418140.1 hypothetical protein [Iodobacter sp. CM08]